MPKRGPRERPGYEDVYRPQSLDVLVVEHNSVVITRGEGWTGDTFAALRSVLRPDVLLINLGDGDTIETLNEDAMREAGWVRAQPS